MDRSVQQILVIDDDELFLEIARVNLERRGYGVEVVADPRKGVNRAIETHFDLILLDLMMPGIRGEEVLSLLKPLSAHQRILVVSGHTGGAYRSRARDLGAIGYLEKPLSSAELCDAVQEVLGGEPPAGDVSGSPAERRLLDAPARLVFGAGQVTPMQRLVAALVLMSFGGVFLWLLWG